MKPAKPTDFRKFLEPLCRSHQTHTVFSAFVRLAACALAAQTREPEYLEEARHWQRDDLQAFSNALGALIVEMEGKPFTDVLGGYYIEFAVSTKGRQFGGEFHTPKTICDLIARITVDGLDFPADRPLTICEPACGAGAMILSFAEAVPKGQCHRLHFTAIDVNRVACDMCFVNTTLWSIPARVIHGNTISGEYWAAWSNFPLLMAAPFGQKLSSQEVSTPVAQGEPPTFRELEQVRAALGQQELALV